MSYAKLRGRIREVFGTQEAFASAIGLSPTAVSMRLAKKTAWNADEMQKATKALHIADDEIAAYFFIQKVDMM